MSEAKDSISFVMEPEPLKLSLSMPSATGDAQTMVVEVKVEAVDGAGYAVESGNMKFDLSATEVLWVKEIARFLSLDSRPLHLNSI